jgi:hypothetical protein
MVGCYLETTLSLEQSVDQPLKHVGLGLRLTGAARMITNYVRQSEPTTKEILLRLVLGKSSMTDQELNLRFTV